jgi:type IV pilus assembly protein PilN
VIRVNLIEAKRRLPVRKPLLDPAQRMTIGCSLILLLAAGTIGWRFWALSKASKDIDGRIGIAQQETARLKTVIDQVQQFEQRRAQLQQRLGLIDQLRKAQTGPVHILDQVSRALPARVWLTELKQTENANEILIEGRCTSVTGLPDFAANLEASGFFKKSVDIVSSQTEVTPTTPGGIVKFVIKAQVQGPAAQSPAATPAGQAPAAQAAKATS